MQPALTSVAHRVMMTTETVLWKSLSRHVGHTLRCVREGDASAAAWVAAGFNVNAVSIRCDDCGEVVIEVADVKRARRQRG